MIEVDLFEWALLVKVRTFCHCLKVQLVQLKGIHFLQNKIQEEMLANKKKKVNFSSLKIYRTKIQETEQDWVTFSPSLLTPVMTFLANFLLRLHTQPRVTMALKSRGTCVSYTPSMSGAESWVANSLCEKQRQYITSLTLLWSVFCPEFLCNPQGQAS